MRYSRQTGGDSLAVETDARSCIEVTTHCACRARDYDFFKTLAPKIYIKRQEIMIFQKL